jgi:outer membrane immunogenic protein
MMRNLLLAGVAVLFAAPAFAADLPTKKAPPPIPVPTEYDWTGIFFGGNIGWAGGTRDFDAYNQKGIFTNSGSDNIDTFIGGFQAGYRYMLPGRFVIGAQASIDWNESSSTTDTAFIQNKYFTSSVGSSGLTGNVLGIAGYAFGNFLPYVTGGWAWSSQTITHTEIFGTAGGLAPGNTEDLTSWRSGWAIGGGLAYHVWANWEVFGQYLYSNYGNATLFYPVSLITVRNSLKANSVTGGVNVKF